MGVSPIGVTVVVSICRPLRAHSLAVAEGTGAGGPTRGTGGSPPCVRSPGVAYPGWGSHPAEIAFSRRSAPGGMVVEREVVSVVWHQSGHRIELTFVEGDIKHMTGSGSYATELARMAGLVQAPSPEGTVRWVRDAGLWYGEMPMSS